MLSSERSLHVVLTIKCQQVVIPNRVRDLQFCTLNLRVEEKILSVVMKMVV